MEDDCGGRWCQPLASGGTQEHTLEKEQNEAKDYEIFPPPKFLFANPASSHFGIF